MTRADEIILKASHSTDVQERVRILNKQAWDIRRSYPKDALELSLKARVLAEHLPFPEGVAYSYLNSGTAYYLLSQYHHALIDLEKAHACFEANGDNLGLASALRNIGNVYHSMNLSELSVECYNKALTLTREENDLQGNAYNLGNIGYVYQKMQQYDKAKNYYLESAILLEKLKDVVGNADLRNNLGNIYIAEGNPEQGKFLIRESLKLAESISHLRGMANARKSLGTALSASGEYPEALTELNLALDLAREMEDGVLITDILQQLSTVYEKQADFKTALHFFKAYEEKKEELQKVSQQILMEALRMKAEAEQSYLEKEYYKKENAELEKARKEIELKNRELERLSIVASKTENSILILAPDGTLEWVNPSFEKLNRCTLESFKKKRGNTIYEASNNPDIRNIIDQCIRSRSSLSYESENRLEDGTTVWESSTLTPIFNEEGILSKLVIIDANVTERKRSEEIIRLKNKDITDSIHYAKYLQEAILPLQESISTVFPESFIVLKPKDIVSGDFYWFSKTDEVGIVAAADCTGHGVPGAFMSVIGNELLNICLHDPAVRNPAAALTMLDHKIKQVFRKGREETLTQDGMDIGLLVWHFKDNLIQFAGAKRPLILVRNKEAFVYEGNRFSIGGRESAAGKLFTDNEFIARKGDMLYLFTDGFADQFGISDPNKGGSKTEKKFMYRKFVKLLTDVAPLPAPEQKDRILQTFDNWKGALDQVDDVLIIGIKIP